LPIQGKKVYVYLLNRKYLCSNPECTHTTFAEPFQCLKPKSRKSERLIDEILEVSVEVSSVIASRLLSDRVVDIGKSTICNILKNKTANEVNKASIKRICIDDFAFKRGRRYGTIMIDIDSKCVIDLLESRETDDVAKWLMEYPNIQLVVRDGSAQYAAAIKQAHPNAIQVNDRFHILKNLTDYSKKSIKKVISQLFRIQYEVSDQSMGDASLEKFACCGVNLPEREYTASMKRKCALVKQVRSLVTKGLSIADIAREVGICPATAKKYLNAEFIPENKQYDTKKINLFSALELHLEKIDKMLRDRCTFKEIVTAIREDGYSGSTATIQTYTTQQRRIIKAANEEEIRNTELIKRKSVIALLYRPIELVKEITSEQVERIVREYPIIGVIYETVRSFKEIMSTKRASDLDSWIKMVLRLGIEEMNSFVKGISKDLEAVKNAIELEYSNGLAEGSVNKLKLTKRIMYGRCNFMLLRNKILLKELGWQSN
jgi:transposase